jgi:carbon storage regulator CsrA
MGLVLRRKADQTIVLNGVITIRILAIEPGKVKLRVDAPPDVIVVRGELLDENGASVDSHGVTHYNGNYQPTFVVNGKAVS